ncbi:MAG: alpha/beta fold hydrolase [Candidatus Nanopelagicales bacterium]
MATMTTNSGVSLAFEEFGDPSAPPVIFIRGTGAAGNRWMPQVEAYKDRYRCVIFDSRGAGASSAPLPPYTVQLMADDTVDLMDHLGIESAHLSGSSLGGAIALRLAAQHPERAMTLQLHSSWLVTDGYAEYSLNLLKTLLLTGGVDFYYEATIPLLFSPHFLGTKFDQIAGILDGMKRAAAPLDGLLGQVEANLTHDGRDDAAAVRLPTLITVGELDLLLPVSESQRLHDAIAGSEFHVFPGGGHLATMESAPDFNRLTLDWLDGKSQ